MGSNHPFDILKNFFFLEVQLSNLNDTETEINKSQSNNILIVGAATFKRTWPMFHKH